MYKNLAIPGVQLVEMNDKEPIKYIIVDDQPLDQMMVRAMAADHSMLHHAGTFSNTLEALAAIKALRPELVFLDIEMPGSSGIELLKTVRDIVPMAVFITSFSDFALNGFELAALDYILKPLTEERFAQCMKRVFEYWEMKRKSSAYDILIEKDVITIKQGHDKMRLSMNEIIYLEALHDYTKIYTETKSYITIGALSNFLEQIPTDHFLRIHRSYAVAGNKITGIKKNEVLCEKIALPIGKTYKQTIANLKL